MSNMPPYFSAALEAVHASLSSGARLIALDGRKMVGKTSLGRYLSYELGIPLISGDWFLDHRKNDELTYYYEDIKRIFDKRFTSCFRQATIIESINVLELVDRIGHRVDFHIYIYNDAERDEDGRYEAEITAYETKYIPRDRADLSLLNPIPPDLAIC